MTFEVISVKRMWFMCNLSQTARAINDLNVFLTMCKEPGFRSNLGKIQKQLEDIDSLFKAAKKKFKEAGYEK